MRAGVFGGSFDPVHCGHLALARGAADHLKLQQVLFVPTRIQPFKNAGPQASDEDRVAMLRLALRREPACVLDERELWRSGPSYTVDTLRELRAERPADELFLLVGADAARAIPRWHRGAEIPGLATIAVIPRADAGAEEAGTLPVRTPPVSATAIREAARQGASLEGMVPPAVAAYIESHGLYRTGA